MNYTVNISSEAAADLRAIFEYIAFELRSVQNASNQLTRLEKEIYTLNQLPERCVLIVLIRLVHIYPTIWWRGMAPSDGGRSSLSTSFMQWCRPVHSGLDPNADPNADMNGRSHWTG